MTPPFIATKNNLHFTWNLFLSLFSFCVRCPVVCREVSGRDEDWGEVHHVNVFTGRPLIFLPVAANGSEDAVLVSALHSVCLATRDRD